MKKMFTMFTTIIMTLVFMTVCVSADSVYVCGDTNNDGVVDVGDAVIIERFIRKDIPYMPYNKQIRESGEPVPWLFEDVVCGDVNNDGEVTIADSVVIQRYVARTIETLPYAGEVEIVEQPDIVEE